VWTGPTGLLERGYDFVVIKELRPGSGQGGRHSGGMGEADFAFGQFYGLVHRIREGVIFRHPKCGRILWQLTFLRPNRPNKEARQIDHNGMVDEAAFELAVCPAALGDAGLLQAGYLGAEDRCELSFERFPFFNGFGRLNGIVGCRRLWQVAF